MCEEGKYYSIEDYLKGMSPNANVKESAIQGALFDAGILPKTQMSSVTEKQKDIAQAYLLIRLCLSPSSSSKVTDKDGDWEHSEGGEQWSRADVRSYLLLARNLLAKWGITDARIEGLIPKWGMQGTGFRNIRKYSK